MTDLEKLKEKNEDRAYACTFYCRNINPEAVPEMLTALKQVEHYLMTVVYGDKERRIADVVAAAIAKATEVQ